MMYVTGAHALNTPMPDTDGDWHTGCLDWSDMDIMESDGSVFGDEHIVVAKVRGVALPCADHARACLDLMERGCFGSVGGMREDLIDNERYTPWILSSARKLMALRPELASDIDRFMRKEYRMAWITFCGTEAISDGCA